MSTSSASPLFGGHVSRWMRRYAAGLWIAGLLVVSSDAQQLPRSSAKHHSDTCSGYPPKGGIVATSTARQDSSSPTAPRGFMPLFDMTADSAGIAPPVWPEPHGTCYIYDRYVVVAWGTPDPKPVAIVRRRGYGGGADTPNCSPDSLPGDFVLRNEWAEYFCGMWGDLLFIDSGTGDIRSLILYDVPTRRRVFQLDGAGEMAGWINEVTVRIWVLGATDMPRSLCPDIPDVLGVGVDSLYALNLKTFRLTPLGSWRCHALQ